MHKDESSNPILQHIRETIYIKRLSDDLSHDTLSFVSDNIEQLLGYKPKDFIKNPALWSSIVHPEDIKEIEGRIRRFFLKRSGIRSKSNFRRSKVSHSVMRERSVRLVYRMLHKKTRKYRWVEDVISISRDDAGREDGIAGSLIDVTELHESKKSKRGEGASLTDIHEKAVVGIYRISLDGKVLYANRAFVKMLGYKSLAEIKNHNLGEVAFVSRESRKELHRRIKAEGLVTGVESTWKRKDGTPLFISESAHVVRDHFGNVLHYEGSAEDLTKEKLAQERMVRLNQILRTLSNINQLIIRNSTPEVLFNEACRILVRDGKYLMAWIGVLDERGGVVHPIAWNGIGDTYLKETIVIGDGKPQNFGLIGEAVRTGLACVCNDLWNDPVYKAWRSEAKRGGFRSAGAFPIRISGKVVGVLNVFADTPNNFTTEDVNLLSELADDMGFALWTIEVRATEKTSNEAIKDREFWLSESQRVARVGSYIFDVKSGTYTASSVLDEIFGIQASSRHDVDAFIALVHPGDREDFSRISSRSAF